MAIKQLKTIRASSDEPEVPGKQEVQKPAKPEKPAAPSKPAKPAEPAKPSEPAKPAKASMFDEFIVVKEDPQMVEGALLAFIDAYKALVPNPTTENIACLAGSLGVTPEDLVGVIGNTAAGINEPLSPANSFDNDHINPMGETNLDPIEKPSFVSASKWEPSTQSATVTVDTGEDEEEGPETEEDENFLLPMSHMDDPVYQYTAKSTMVKADSTPRNNRTGIDDGAPVVEEGDDSEQEALINDGVVDLNDEVTDINNRSINDDGLS